MPRHGPDGARIYYEDGGRGDTVLLMPGWAGSIPDPVNATDWAARNRPDPWH